jgi:hypothetical protein
MTVSKVTLPTLCAAQFLLVLDVTIVAIALPDIVRAECFAATGRPRQRDSYRPLPPGAASTSVATSWAPRSFNPFLTSPQDREQRQLQPRSRVQPHVH